LRSRAATEKTAPQEIIAMRVNAVPPSHLDGARLKQAHARRRPRVRPLQSFFTGCIRTAQACFSVASLREPARSTSRPWRRHQYPGVALFVVCQGRPPPPMRSMKWFYGARLAAQTRRRSRRRAWRAIDRAGLAGCVRKRSNSSALPARPESRHGDSARRNDDRLKLREQIDHHNYRYYVLDDPESLGHCAFDALMRELQSLEAAHPRARRPRLADATRGRHGFPGVPRGSARVPMLSLDTPSPKREHRRFRPPAPRERSDVERIVYSAEPKLDGLAITLRYEKGDVVQAATRGDGMRGEGSSP
jgi:hypothetical protein